MIFWQYKLIIKLCLKIIISKYYNFIKTIIYHNKLDDSSYKNGFN